MTGATLSAMSMELLTLLLSGTVSGPAPTCPAVVARHADASTGKRSTGRASG